MAHLLIPNKAGQLGQVAAVPPGPEVRNVYLFWLYPMDFVLVSTALAKTWHLRHGHPSAAFNPLVVGEYVRSEVSAGPLP
jgi:hypothetical protein